MEDSVTPDATLDLGKLDEASLVELEALLMSDYQEKKSSEDFESSSDKQEALLAVLATTKAVRSEMSERVITAAADAEMSAAAGEGFLAAVTPVVAEVVIDVADEVVLEVVAEVVVAEVVAEAPADLVADFDLEKVASISLSPSGLASDEKPVLDEGPSDRGLGITAGADIRGFNAGQEFKGWDQVAQAMVAKRPDIRSKGAEGDGNQTLVASVHGDFPVERRLGNDLDDTMNKINNIASSESIVASGGLCAPLTPYYQLTTYGDAVRPVRDMLPNFKADRGGIRFLPAPKITDLAGSNRITTAAQDAAGYTNQTPAGTTAPKPCLHVTCEAEQSCIIDAHSRCLSFGNMGSRTYPEQVEAWIKLGMAEFARAAETKLLDGIATASTAVTTVQQYGATTSIMEQIALLVTSVRSRNRISSSLTMRALMPWWIKEVFRVDLAAQAPGDGLGRLSVSDAQIAGWFESRGISITFFQDNTTAAGAPFAIPTAGNAVPTWPTEFQWFLFPEGSFLYLDGGTLDLGLVRDSTLNSQNDYTLFYEEFNGLCFIGLESYSVTSAILPTGTYAPADAARTA
jgi:hypothetical protein